MIKPNRLKILERASIILDILIQFAVLGVLVVLVFVLMTLNSCASYPTLPEGNYGTEPVPEYFAVGFLPEHPDDGKLVQVSVGELRYASYVFDSYYALIDVVNNRGTRMEDMMVERDVLLEKARESRKTGILNTVSGTGIGILGGFAVGFTTLALVSTSR